MSAYDSLPDGVTEIFGAESTAEEAYGLLTVDVPAGSWIAALETARDKLGCTYFDWLSAVDEPGTGFRVCAHVVALGDGRVRRLLVRTTVPHAAPVLPSAVDVYAGAAWHERETHEMFGVDFTDHPHLVPLLLPDSFEGHPLRKDFVLAARVAKAWPGAKEPGESEHGGPKRRQMLPPGVPDPNEWGPLKGQLPPAPARPARTPRAAGAAADRPPRRTRSVSEGSASQPTPAAPETPGPSSAPEAPAVRPRRTRSVSEGSASQPTPAAPKTVAPSEGAPEAPAVRPRRTRSASEGSASQQAGAVAGEPAAPPRTRSADAPWHNPKPAFTEETPEQAQAETPADDKPEAAPTRESAPASERAEVQEPTRAPEQTAEPTPADASPPAHEPTQADASTPAEDPSRAEDPTPAQAPPAREPASGDEGPDASGPAESTRPAESTDPAGGDPRE
ncbi:NADH-quinone oxidoreductase subunit C [Streptomyces sp. NPDC001691]|uniref:NADH-quinone oxidoreductase subunit C n=1 Tax=Streptomyces sp. NPDC001691 TaxID=3364600 RepID=UPI003687AC56